MDQEALRTKLKSFAPSDALYPCSTIVFCYTEGVKFLAETAGLQWLVEAIANWQPIALQDTGLAEFQVWELVVKGDGSGHLFCSRDSDDAVFRQRFAKCQTPLDYVRLYVERGVLMLPSEH